MNIDASDKTGHQRILAQAFDQAWALFLQTEGRHFDTSAYRRALANKIVALSRMGVIDVDELSQTALIHLRALVAETTHPGGDTHDDPHHHDEMHATRDAPSLAPRVRIKPTLRFRRRPPEQQQ